MIGRDDIIRMAQEAGCGWAHNGTQPSLVGEEILERFATLVAEHERERIKTLNAPEIEKANAHIAKLEKALKELDEIYGDSPQAERIIVPALYGREV
jgi:hypothetical protein